MHSLVFDFFLRFFHLAMKSHAVESTEYRESHIALSSKTEILTPNACNLIFLGKTSLIAKIIFLV